MNYQKDIDNFIEVISKDKDIDLTTFYENIKTLKIGKGTDDLFNMGYDNSKNSIFFNDEETYNNAIYHELFHVASNKTDAKFTHSGFYTWSSDTKQVYGLGLNEGYTESLQRDYFKVGHAYPIQVFYIDQLKKIIDPTILKKAYFSSNIKILIKELNKYASLEEINNFINSLDIYTFTVNPSQKDKSYTPDQVQEALTYCSCFLAEKYVQKLLYEQPIDFPDRVFSYFGEFSKRFRFQDYPEVNLSIPLDKGIEILEKAGFKRK